MMDKKLSGKELRKEPSARDKMLCAAFDLFHEKGIRATSVDDILDYAGTGKSQFYHYFKSKEGLVHSLLQSLYEKIKNKEWDGVSPILSWEGMERWFARGGEAQEEHCCKRCCPIGTIAANLGPEDELIRQDVRLILEALKDAPRDFFLMQKARGKLREDADPDSLATFCVSVIQGGSLQSKAEHSTGPYNASVTHALNYLKSFIKN